MAKMPEFCPRFPLILIDKSGQERNILLRPRCKQWVCKYCAEINRRIWRKHLKNRLNQHPLSVLNWSFTTITLPAHVHQKNTEETGIARAIRFIRARWDMTMKTCKREYGAFQYIRVLESHKTGIPHIHLLMSVWFEDLIVRPKFHQSPRLEEIFDSYDWGFTDTRHLENGVSGTVNYVTKYMTKTSPVFHQLVNGARLRRIQTSRKIGAPPKEKTPIDWIPRYCIHQRDMKHAETYGKYWWDLNEQRVITKDDFEHGDYYPQRE